MKFHTDETLQFWIDCEYQMRRAEKANRTSMHLIAAVLHSHERSGDAMRYLSAPGQIGWKATPLMLSKLADLQQDAEEDLANWP